MLFSTQNIYFDIVKSKDDLEQILALQAENLKENLPESMRFQDGFVTVNHTLDQLAQMNIELPQIVAKADDQIIGYALAMPQSMKFHIKSLIPMFEMLDQLIFNGKPLKDYEYYVMGQICIQKEYRGKGIFKGLYEMHKTLFYKNFDLCVTEISTANPRSIKAHEKIGFQTINAYRDDIDEWNVVVLELGV